MVCGGGLKPCLITRLMLSILVVNPHLLSRFQIGAYDQQIWEKSVEQREIKVRRFWARFGSGRPSSSSLMCSAHFSFLSLSFLLFLKFSVMAVFVLSFPLFPL